MPGENRSEMSQMPLEARIRSDATGGAYSGSLLAFFLLAYALMWACFFSVVRWHIPAHGFSGSVLLLLGAVAPSIAALGVTAGAQGRPGVRNLLAPVLHWRVAARWYVFAVGYMAAVKLFAACLHRLAFGAWPRFGDTPLYLIPVAILFSTPVQAGEEIGWRGFALGRLASRFGLGPASVLLGLLWACWHLPQFFVPEADTYGQSFLVYVLQVTAVSVAMAWLWARTGRSLLLPMLFHAAANNTKDIVPSAVPGATNSFRVGGSPIAWITVALLWICAAFFLARMRKSAEWQRPRPTVKD